MAPLPQPSHSVPSRCQVHCSSLLFALPSTTCEAKPLFFLSWKIAILIIVLFILLPSSSWRSSHINFLRTHYDTSMLAAVASHCLEKSIGSQWSWSTPYFSVLVNCPHLPCTLCILGVKNTMYLFFFLPRVALSPHFVINPNSSHRPFSLICF